MDRHNSKSQFFFVMASLSIVLLVNPGPAVYDMIAPEWLSVPLQSQHTGQQWISIVPPCPVRTLVFKAERGQQTPRGLLTPPPLQARIQSGLQKAAYSGLMQHKHAPCNRLSGSTPATIRNGHTTDWLQKSGDEGGHSDWRPPCILSQ
jgi:hypothetical protein